MKNVELILRGNITKYLFQHTLTIFIGLVCLSSLALVDMYFIGKLGDEELAAVSFGAPVLLFGINLLLSIGAALMIVVSKLVGEGNKEEINRVSSAGIYLTIGVGILLCLLGLLGNDALFRAMRADDTIINLLGGYMQLIYLSFVFMGGMVASTNVMRGFGDVKMPTIVMATVVFCNLILDPLLIHGYGPFPALGLPGAALATLCSICVGLTLAVYKLRKYIHFQALYFLHRWGNVLQVAVPITISKTMLPTANAVITAILAVYGNAAVTAYGIGYRVDLLVLLFMMAMSIVVAPFIGQNYGAGNISRIRECIKISLKFAVVYGIISALVVILTRYWIGDIFTDDPAIIAEVSLYLLLVPLGYFFNGIYYIGASVLDTLNRPTIAAIITFFHLFGLYIPLAYLGEAWLGIPGIYAAFPVSSFLVAIIMVIVVKNTMHEIETGTEGKYWQQKYGVFRSVAMYYWKPFNRRRLKIFYQQFIKPGDLCFDIGAHLGNRVNAWRAIGANVIAVDPQPSCVNYLKKRFGKIPEVKIIDQAVGATRGKLPMHVSYKAPTVSTLANEDWRSALNENSKVKVDWNEQIEVEVTTLDHLIQQYGMPDFCKIDVEDYEAEVLRGLSKPIKTLSFEFFNWGKERTKECIELLEQLGNYEYNWSIGESQQMQSGKWLSEEALLNLIFKSRSGNSFSGDIYARLKR